MKITRIITSVVLAGLAALTLAGCSKPGDPADARIDNASAAMYAHIYDAGAARDCMVLYRMHAAYAVPMYSGYALNRAQDLGCQPARLFRVPELSTTRQNC